MILTGVSVMQLFTKPLLATNSTFWLDFTQSRALGESLFSLSGYTFSARREPVFGILQLRVKSATALSVWQMCSYCSSPTQTVASKKRAVISRMFPAFIITAPYGSPKTESVLNLLGNCLSWTKCQRQANRTWCSQLLAGWGKWKGKPPNFLTPWVFWLAPASHNHNTAN